MSGVKNDDTGPVIMTEAQMRAIAQAGDMLKVLAEVVLGYRKTLINGGVSAEAADRMAEVFHSKMIGAMG